jgi:uncharacterized protein (TIGR02118 family)
MLKAYVIVHRRADLDWDTFARHWRDVHAPLVLRLPGLRYFAQLPTSNAFFGGATPCDGLSEIWFDNEGALRAAFESPEGLVVLADNERFVDVERTKLVTGDVDVWLTCAAGEDVLRGAT